MSRHADSGLAQAEQAAAEGDMERVVELARIHAGAGVSDAEQARWALLLWEAGDPDGEAARLACGITTEELRKEVLSVAADEPEAGDASGEDDAGEDEELDLRPLETGDPDKQLVEAFLRFFGGRRDLYARQWHEERRNRTGYRPVREPLTSDVVRSHLSGRHTIGQYLLWPDATVSFAALDLDLSGSALEALRACEGGDVSALSHDGLRSYARRLIDAATSLSVPLFPEDSGSRGVHLWVFFEPRRRARAARDLLGQIVASAGPQPADVSVELFPKQDVAGPRGLSSLVKLPLGVHQATLRACPLLDEALRPIHSAHDALARLQPVDPPLLDAIIGRRVVALPAPELEVVDAAPAPTEHGSPRGLAEALREIEPGPPERRACESVIRGCEVVAALVTKAYEQRRLEPDEARAVAYTLGLVGPEGAVASEALIAAGASLKELERVRRGLPTPTGCRKLQRLAPSGVRCHACPKGRNAVPYATPALFAVGPTAPSRPRHAAFGEWLQSDEAVVQGPLEGIGATLRRIEGRLERLERAVEEPSDDESSPGQHESTDQPPQPASTAAERDGES